MKVLEVREVAGEQAAIALHDQVTVVRGLDPLRRGWLLEVLGRITEGIELDATGTVEAHGITFPLDRESRALLDLEAPVRSVVKAEDLPGHDPRLSEAIRSRDRALVRRRELTAQITAERETLAAAVDARTAAEAEVGELDRGEGAARAAVAAATAARTRLEADLESAREEVARHRASLAAAVQARDAATEAVSALETRVTRARERHQVAMSRASTAAGSLEQAQPVANDDPTDALAAARAELARAEAAAGEADPDDASSPVSQRLAALERRRVELNRLREAIGDNDSAAVAEALASFEDADSEPTQVVAALAMADTWRDLHQQIQALDAGVSEEELAAEERVAQARQAVVEAEIDFNQPVLTPEQITKVEAVHAAVLETQDRAEGRFGSGRVRKKLDEARNEERRVLERLGFSTYADYMMSSSSRGVGPANRALLDAARSRLSEAEELLKGLPGAEDRARRRNELLQRRDAVAPRVAALLGHEPTGPEAEDELRALREPDAAGQLATDDLAAQLSSAGIDVGEPPYEADDVVLLARVYLAEQGEADGRRAELTDALDALDAEVQLLRTTRDGGGKELPERPPLPPMAEPTAADLTEPASAGADEAQTLREARWAEVAAARTAVSEGEQAVARHREANDALTELTQQLERCQAEERDAAAALAEAEAELAVASEGGTDGTAETDAVAEAEAALARASEREEQARSALAAQSTDGAVAALVAEAATRRDQAEQAVTDAAAAEQTTAASLAEVDAAFADATATEEQAKADAASIDRSSLVDDIDWELMSRLAQLRSVGLAGSVPLILDDPFAVLTDDEVERILDRVARLSEAVQVVLVTEREAAVAWAAQAGSERALVVGS